MKVVVLSANTESLVNFRGPLIRAMRARGHEVVAVGPDREEPYLSALAEMGVRFERVPVVRASLNPLGDLAYLARIARLLRRERPGAVLAYTIKPNVYGTAAARLTGVPVRAAMVEGMGSVFETGTPRQRFVAAVATALYRAGLHLATVAFFLNPDDRAVFERRGLVPPGRGRVIAGTGVDVSHYAPSPPPAGPPVFLTIARMIREKGVALFAEAARRLKADGVEATFRMIGPFDPHPDALSPQEVAAWEREGIVEYLGVVRDVRPHLAACSVFVLPSYYHEGVPRTLLEAMATGRAIVTSDAPGCRETVVPGVNGELIPLRDVDALCATLRRLAGDPERVRAMGVASRRLACERFDVRAVNREVLGAMGLEAPVAASPSPETPPTPPGRPGGTPPGAPA